jgi:hypothetical protein
MAGPVYATSVPGQFASEGAGFAVGDVQVVTQAAQISEQVETQEAQQAAGEQAAEQAAAQEAEQTAEALTDPSTLAAPYGRRLAEGLSPLAQIVPLAVEGNHDGLNIKRTDETDIQYGTDYEYTTESILWIKSSMPMTISGTSQNNARVVIDTGSPTINADITIEDLKIELASNGCAFEVKGCELNLMLVGENVLKSNGNFAGLQLSGGGSVNISGDDPDKDSLTATAGSTGAGIGGGNGTGAGGNIKIENCTIYATGGAYGGAGIGGGYIGAKVGRIIISGSGTEVSAKSGISGAGIGGGDANSPVESNRAKVRRAQVVVESVG